jgi:hypothetical protein
MARSNFRSQGTANSNAVEIYGDRKEPEELLWIAVLAKAVDDAIYTSDYNEALNAISWIEGEGRDFRFVCHLAGRDSKYIVKKLLHKILERKRKIEEWRESIRKKIANGMAMKNAILAAKQKVGGTIGRKHKGGYHSGKRWGRKWHKGPYANQETLQ